MTQQRRIPAYHPDTNIFLGEVTIIEERKAYPAWLKQGHGNARAVLNDFRGDLAWIHDREGHAGKPYWPSADSGLTLDPGVDLGFQTFGTITHLYQGILSPTQFEALRPFMEVKGVAVKQALQEPVIRSIRITPSEAVMVMPFAANPYWTAITKRFPALLKDECPSSVQTAMLSIAYNRGPNNPKLDALGKYLALNDWRMLAKVIASMQQDHKVPGIRIRRRLEADLIYTELDAQVS